MTNPYRILVVDDDSKVADAVRAHLKSFGPELEVHWASDPEDAEKLLTKHLFDLALLDLFAPVEDGSDYLMGPEVFTRIDSLNLDTRVMLMTRHALGDEAKTVLQLTSDASAWRLCGYITKIGNFGANLQNQVGRRVNVHRRERAQISGLNVLSEALRRERGRDRYALPDGRSSLRESAEEIGLEVSRLISRLYVRLPGERQRKSVVSVDLTPMERRGLSAAVVFNAAVNVSFEGLTPYTQGHKTVLKVGPKRDIMSEASRFVEYVRHGVELKHRVELLGVAESDALGALVYSFAGGLYANEVASLDEILVEDLRAGDMGNSCEIVAGLFGADDWYSVEAESADASGYFLENFGTDLEAALNAGEGALLELSGLRSWPAVNRAEKNRRGEGLILKSPRGIELTTPDLSILGWGSLISTAPTCLVHGDMHGGNVLVESVTGDHGRRGIERSCLIDFRYAGPGPRCIDAACLELTIRLADAIAYVMPSPPSGLLGAREEPWQSAVEDMMQRVEEERRLYAWVFLREGPAPDSSWSQVAALVLRGLLKCFPDVTLSEYLSTSIRYAIRGLSFGLEDLARVRVETWLACQYELARELGGG